MGFFVKEKGTWMQAKVSTDMVINRDKNKHGQLI